MRQMYVQNFLFFHAHEMYYKRQKCSQILFSKTQSYSCSTPFAKVFMDESKNNLSQSQDEFCFVFSTSGLLLKQYKNIPCFHRKYNKTQKILHMASIGRWVEGKLPKLAFHRTSFRRYLQTEYKKKILPKIFGKHQIKQMHCVCVCVTFLVVVCLFLSSRVPTLIGK